MLVNFSFLKYLSPTWYFHLKPKGEIPYFPDWDKVDARVRSVIDFDEPIRKGRCQNWMQPGRPGTKG